MDIQDMRRAYLKGGLRRKDLNEDPVEQFSFWFNQAVEAELLDPNAMILATATADGAPSQRTVLLKAFDKDGFTFFTNYGSKKAKQISENSRVSLLFPWISLERQVIITGRAEKISSAVSLKYFITRPVDSQLGAWASDQSSIISSRKMLEMKFQEMKEKFKDGDIPIPSFWGGYCVVPESFEFWQGGDSRLHDRFMYTRSDDGNWEINRLAS